MNKLLAFFLIIFLNFFPINAEIVKKIEIDGNKRISDETIKVYGDIKNLDRNFTKQDLDKWYDETMDKYEKKAHCLYKFFVESNLYLVRLWRIYVCFCCSWRHIYERGNPCNNTFNK